MRFIRFVCLFAILISILMLAQSSRVHLANQPNGLSIAERPQQAVHPTLSQVRQDAHFATHKGRAFKASAIRRGRSSSGLNFASVVSYGSGGIEAYSVAVADVNADGKPDLVVTNQCPATGKCNNGLVSVLLGNGDGTFQTAVAYDSGGLGANSVVVADVNGDGKLDVVVGNPDSSSVGVLLGNGDGTFQAAVTYGSGGNGGYEVAVADVNADGKLDLVVANSCDTNCNNGSVGVLLGNGDGTFQSAVSYASGGLNNDSVAVGDVNGDGKPDLLAANECSSSNNCNGSIGVLLGNGDGTFQAAVTYGSGGYGTRSVAIADVNGDGKPDLLAANLECSTSNCNPADSVVGVLLGNGDGTFQTAVAHDSGAYAINSAAVADVNGDGKPDLICKNDTSNSTPTVGVLLGNGDGTFQTAVAYDSNSEGGVGAAALSLAVADVNGDGKPDLLAAGFGNTVGVLINTSIQLTTTALVSSLNPSNFGQAVTFTATVTAQPGFQKGPPTGTVSFYDGTTNIGNSNLNGGVATLTTSTLAVGTHSMTATYNGDVNFLPSTSPVLYQVVQGAIASLSPPSLNFGNQTVGIASAPQKVTLTNNGNIDLTISSIQVTGTNSGDFAQTNNCPGSIPPNKGCQINVTFTPTATGTRNAAVSITDNAPNGPQLLPLTGVGVLPAATFSPTSLTFPTQLIFTSSPAQPVQLTNTGLGILMVKKIAATGQFSQTNNCPSSIAPGASCTINIKFHPTTKGVLHGGVSVTDNAPGSPQKVPLTGTSTYVQLRPTKLEFGVQPVGTKSLPKRIALTNQGHSTLHITSITITGVDAGDFAESDNCGHQLPSGVSCFIKVTFKPVKKGKRTADVSISDDGGGSPQKTALSGTGT